jgi:cell division protein FtsW
MNLVSNDKRLFIVTVIFLVVFGIIITMSASISIKVHNNIDLTPKIFINATLAFFAMVFVIFAFPIEKYNSYKYIYPAVLIVMVLLLLPLILGIKINGAYRWLPLGVFNLQPAELAKIVLIVFLSFVFSSMEGERPGLSELIPIFVVCSAIMGFVFLEKDIGIPVVMMLTMFAMLLVAKLDYRILALIFLVIVIVVVLAIVLAPHRMNRIKSYVHRKNGTEHIMTSLPDTQTEAVMVAVGSAGLKGKGLGNSEYKFGSLSAAHNDYIFSLIIEELGLIGFFIIVGLYIMFLIFGIKMANQAETEFGHYFILGVVFLTMIQAILHMFVNVDLIPSKGFGLPFVSYGGSSLIAHMIMAGLAISVKLKGEV